MCGVHGVGMFCMTSSITTILTVIIAKAVLKLNQQSQQICLMTWRESMAQGYIEGFGVGCPTKRGGGDSLEL